MEKIAEKLTKYIVSKGIVAEKEKNIYIYGFQMGIELCFNLMVSIAIAIIMNMIPQATIFFVIFIPLRSYAGGFHFKSYLACFGLSVVTYWGVLTLATILTAPGKLLVLFGGILLIGIRCLAPVENIYRVPDAEERKYFLKKLQYVMIIDGSLILTTAYLKKNQLLIVIILTLALVFIAMIAGKAKYYYDIKKIDISERYHQKGEKECDEDFS